MIITITGEHNNDIDKGTTNKRNIQPRWGPLKLWDEEEKFHHVTERDFSCTS